MRKVLGHLDRRFLRRRERLVLRHEVDDAVDAFVLEAVADVDQRDGGHEAGPVCRQREADDPAERRADERGTFDPELVQERRDRRRQRTAVHLVDGVGVAVTGKVGREHMVGRREGGAELLPHVRGLPAAVQAHDGCGGVAPPLEVVDLAPLDDGEAAAPAGRDVVARREELELGVGGGHAPLPRPRSQAALSR
jgi:hypothetical protein